MYRHTLGKTAMKKLVQVVFRKGLPASSMGNKLDYMEISLSIYSLYNITPSHSVILANGTFPFSQALSQEITPA